MKTRNSQFHLALIFISLLSFGCESTRGLIYVGQPQVHTREGLVDERIGELEWLRAQLKKTDDIKFAFQGKRDFREFVGFHNELKAEIDPTQGRLNQLELERQETGKRADIWRERLGELQAKRRFDEAKDEPPSKTEGEIKRGTLPESKSPLDFKLKEPLPDPSKLKDSSAEPNVLDLFHDKLLYRDAVNATIKGTRLDDSHDLKGSTLYELTFNMSLIPGNRSEEYAQIDLMLHPRGDDQDRIFELLRLFKRWKAGLQSRIASEIAGLQTRYRTQRLSTNDRKFLKWFFSEYLPGLTMELKSRNTKISRFSSSGIISEDARKIYFKILSEAGLYALLSGNVLKNESALANSKLDTCSNDKSQTLEKCLRSPPDVQINNSTDEPNKTYKDELKKLKNMVDVEASAEAKKIDGPNEFNVQYINPTAVQELEKLSKEITGDLKGVLESLNPKCSTAKTQDTCSRIEVFPLKEETTYSKVIKGIPWAIWSKYRGDLSRVIHITEPEVQIINDKLSITGLEVQDVPELISVGKRDDECPWGTPVNLDTGISNTGSCTFVNRLLKAEKNLHVLAIEPKEYAQNVSDVSAREEMLNLVASVHALLPQQGANIQNNAQYVRRQQELLHAITRRPLLVGFGQGGRKFGWVAGPKFAIEKGEAVFRHVPIRHDFSASIVVPAWWNKAYISGGQSWIDWKGRPQAGKCIWTHSRPIEDLKAVNRPVGGCLTNDKGFNTIELSLPAPNNQMEKITEALMAFSSNINPVFLTPRPLPAITYPDTQIQVQATHKNDEDHENTVRKILVRGSNLWRNPQVFLGSHKASRVEVQSDMGGLLAEFQSLPYLPEEDNLDLRVVTTFGSAVLPKRVKLLQPPEKQKKDSSGANGKITKLLTHYIDNQQGGKGKIQFAFNRPKSYSKLSLKLLPEKGGAPIEGGKETWDRDEKKVTFAADLPTTDPDVVLAELRLLLRDGDPGKLVLKDEKIAVARFKNKAQRSGVIDPKTTTITFDEFNEPNSPLRITLNKNYLKALDVAYPGFKSSRNNPGKIQLVLSKSVGGRVNPSLPVMKVDENNDPDDLILEVLMEDLKLKANELRKLHDEMLLVNIQYEGSDGTSFSIPTVKSADATKQGTVKFLGQKLQEVSPELGIGTIAFNNEGKTVDNITLTIPSTAFKKASAKYPGFKEATEKSNRFTLAFQDKFGDSVGPKILLAYKNNGQNLRFRVSKEVLNNRKNGYREALVLMKSAIPVLQFEDYQGNTTQLKAKTGAADAKLTVTQASPVIHKLTILTKSVNFVADKTTKDSIQLKFNEGTNDQVLFAYPKLRKAIEESQVWLVFREGAIDQKPELKMVPPPTLDGDLVFVVRPETMNDTTNYENLEKLRQKITNMVVFLKYADAQGQSHFIETQKKDKTVGKISVVFPSPQ